jgi:hypothetical protein
LKLQREGEESVTLARKYSAFCRLQNDDVVSSVGMRSRRSFKKPKTVPYGPKCAAKVAHRAEHAAGIV